MKTADLIRMCRENLFRRKARTFLSVLGVVIGCCSILLMVSIGVGLSRSNEAWLDEMGALNAIDVYQPYDTSSGAVKLDNDALRSMRALGHVESLIPTYSANDLTFCVVCGNNDRYKAPWMEAAGFDTDVFEDAGLVLLDGDLPKKSFDVLMGEQFEYALQDSRKPEGRNQIEYYMYDSDAERPDPYMELVGREITLQVKDEDDKVVASFPLHVTGKLKEDYNFGYVTVQGLMLRAEDLQKIADEAHKALGKKRQTLTISSLKVMADDIDNVSALEEEIRALGFETNSMESMRESTRKETATIQLVLGGIGAVSLLVAAIGIINTMIMSVSERTKEIGIMKAIGCYVRDIRKLFLLEAASIGLLGGAVGSVLSIVISCIINLVANGLMAGYSDESYTVWQTMFTAPTRVSIIPLWLFAFGLLFSTGIGLAAGFYPANKAVRISALEAMHNE